ncbi:MAG: replication-associated recombination protein A [Bacilli bacterium]|nr:replication-associated recombination protein A [Bacilli bacterium]
MSLFDYKDEDDIYRFKPLAEKMRPKRLEDFFGQDDVVGPSSSIRKMIKNDNISSMILWGPPGVGKTTLAKIIADKTSSSFHELSAVTSGVKEIKEIIEISKFNKMNGRKTILFVDEIHRFNKAQQDAFLPYVENGDVILIGATTENPSFEVNSALLSRTKVYVLNSLTEKEIIKILKRAMKEFYPDLSMETKCYNMIANISNGDARVALNTLENLVNTLNKQIGRIKIEDLEKILQKKTFLYDKNGEEHYNLISALHKSIRNSDPDAALYYLARMLEAGEDPLYVARRLVRFSSEDIGLANSNALVQAVSTFHAVKFIGMPECNVILAQLVVYLSVSPKSNSLYKAYEEVKLDAIRTANEKVPLHLRNATTKLNDELGYGAMYKYAHDYDGAITNMQCLPDSLKNQKYYIPTNNGNEKNVKQVLDNIKRIKEEFLSEDKGK